MERFKLAVIGGGNIGTAIISGLIKQKHPAELILLYEIDQQKREILAKKYGIKVSAHIDEHIRDYRAILIAVKPQQIKEALKALKPHVDKSHLIISVAAGISIASIISQLKKTVPVVRSMPNLAARIGKSAIAMCCGSAVTEKDRRTAQSVLESIGTMIEVEEKQLDAVTGLSGSGPAFVFMMIEALTDGGVLMGLPREKAYEFALLTVEGAVSYLRETDVHPKIAQEMVASPGGTTIEGLFALEGGGFKGLIMDAVRCAAEKSREIGRDFND